MTIVTDTAHQPTEERSNFEQALAALEKVVHELEEGQLGLDQAVGCYETGVKLLKQCHALLDQAERRIELLTGVDAQGQPVVEPFDEQVASSLEEKSRNRAKRRTAGRRVPESPPPDADMDEPGSLF